MKQHHDQEIKIIKEVLQAFRDLDTSFPLQYAICLCEIYENEGLSLTELAQKTGLTLSTVSRIVGALSKQRQSGLPFDLVQIEYVTGSRRQKKLSLSNRGRKLFFDLFKDIACLF